MSSATTCEAPRRILLVANTLPPRDLSGVGEQVLQLAAGLSARGHHVRILGRGPAGAWGPKVLFPLAVVPSALAALHRFRPDVVQVHESDGALVALLVALLRRLPGRRARPLLVALLQVSYREEARAVRPLVWQGRTLGRPGARERRFRTFKASLQVALGRLTARLADVVLVPSRATADEIERDYLGGRGGGIEILPNVTGGLPRPPAGRRELDGAGRLLFVGRLRIRKGVEILLAAMARLAAEGLPAQLAVAGDGEHRAALEAAAEDLGVAPAVRFLGRCDAGRVRGLLASARALVVPSIYEGMPLVVLEAMDAGVAVVASRVSGIPEVVEDGVTGWLVPPEDPEALAGALREALSRPDEAARRGAAGHRRVEERYRPETAAVTWERAIARRGPVGYIRPPREGRS